VEALVAQLSAAASDVEGVTLLGGEPFEQAAPLARFARAARRLGLSVVVFSGYALEELRAPGAPAGSRNLLAATDLLIDGRYDAGLPERTRRWAGSANQRFHYLTGRYTPAIERPGPGEPLQTVEVRLLADGQVLVNGWPERWGG
jgi:anaerobic ribonucleoside-triphosphate reductase activating protein